MAKNKVKMTKDNKVEENVEPTLAEESNEVLEVVEKKPSKEDKKAKATKKDAKGGKKKAKNAKPRRNFFKEIFSELKKVNWPSFKKACKQTGSVLVVVAVFMLVVLGIDTLLAKLFELIAIK